MDSGLGPRRPAPPPPSRPPSSSSSSSSSAKQNGTVTFRTQSTTKVASGKETVVVVQRKSSNSKRMPLLKKLTRDKGRSGGSSGSGDGQVANAAASKETTNRNRNSEGNHNNSNTNKKRSVFFKLTDSKSTSQSSRPMIIRPGTVQVRKKAPPPRPPPPKINKSCPPSYDEVLRADVDNFIGQMNGPRANAVNYGRTQQRPASVSLSSRTVSMPLLAPPSRPTTRPRPQRNVDVDSLLIDFDAPSPPINNPSHNQMKKKEVQSLLDLDDIFESDPFSPITANHSNNLAAKYNLGPRVLPRGPIVALGDHFLRSSSISSDLWGDGASVRRGSVPVGTSLGDDWLQSCLRETTGSSFQGSTSPPPALPPRPKAEESFVDDGDIDRSRSTSPLPPAMTPPPVPPLPMADVASSYNQDVETMPPLPPRPKSYDASKPRAIAVYDYNAVQNDDLSFKAGDVITLIQEVSDNWLYGSNGQREGVFPKNFVDILVPLNGFSEDDSNVNEDVRGPRCCAIYDFVGESGNELSFVAGNVISLEERVGNDWFRGTLHGNEGLFPVTFVEVIEELPFEDSFISNTNSQMYVATYDFVGESGELTFNEGDRIVTTGEINDEWLVGKVVGTDREGRFPKNFVHQL